MLPGIVLGAAALATSAVYMPRQSPAPAPSPSTHRPAAAPLLAGFVLAGFGLAVTSIPVSGALAAIAFLVAITGLATLWILVRRSIIRPLSLGWCRRPGMFLLLAAIAIAAMPNLFFYTNLLMQYRYGASLIVIALLLIVSQASAALGGLASGPVSARLGSAQAAAVGLAICGLLRLAPALVSTSAPIWVPVIALAVSSAPAAFLIGPMTNTLLSRAPRDDSGTSASVNKATWTLGSVFGGAVIGAVTFSAFQSRLAHVLTIDGLPPADALTIAEAIRSGAALANVAVTINEPLARSDILAQGPGLVQAQMFAYGVMGLASAIITLAAAVFMVLFIRRTRRLGESP